MRSILVFLAIVALTGCPTTQPDTLGTGTATSDPADLAKLGTQLDKSDQRVAASIAVASENADKPSVVKAELGVAAAYLPKADQTHIDYVRNRVGRNDPEEYKRAMEAGKKLLAVIDANWDKAEKEAKANKAALDAANCQIDKLKSEVAQAKKDIVTYTCAGVGALLALAAVGLLWARQIVGAIAAGIGAGSLLAFPALVDTPWFLPSLAGLGGLLIVWAGTYMLWTKKTSQKSILTPSPQTDEPPSP